MKQKERPAKPRTRNKARTREQLIAAGMTLFAERGLDGPSLDDICAKAGLTRGAFYVNFADRDDFLLAVMDHVGAALHEELFATSEGGFVGAVQRFVTATATGTYPLMPEGGIRPYQLLDACARSPAIRERYLDLVRKSTERTAEVLAEGQREGVVRSDLPKETGATFVIALVIGLQTLADLGVQVPLASLAADFVRLVGVTPRS
jgi:TetR/AcrR family transcriptional repressor of nem operon